MSTNPVPSILAEDIKINARDIDRFVVGTANTFVNRLGVSRLTIQGIIDQATTAIQNTGWFPVAGSFEDGGTITEYNQVLLLQTADGSNGAGYYSWGGELPKIVTAASTPSTTGGIGATAWVYRADAVLRSELAVENSEVLVGNAFAHNLRDIQSSQKTSLLDMVKANSYVKGIYYRGDGVNSDRFWVGYNINGKGAEFRMLKDFDGLFIVRGSIYNDLLDGIPTRASNFVGTFNFTSQPNSYTTQVGATFDLDFIGDGLKFNSYRDNRGGVWRFTIDAGTLQEQVVDISTFTTVAAVPPTPETQLVIDGLNFGEHTCTAEFIGDDPLNPPSGGVSRGWLFFSNVNPLLYAGFGLSETTLPMDESGALLAMNGSSIPDFAIFVTAEGSGITGDWVPAHSNAGAARNITTEVLIDGVDIGSDTSLYSTFDTCDCVIVKHTYEAYSTFDVAGDFKLWDGVLIKKFDKNGLHVSHNIKITTDTFCSIGYFAPMVPVVNNSLDTVKYNSGFKKSIEVPASEIDTPVPYAPSSLVVYDSVNNYGIAYEINSIADGLGFHGKPLESNSVFFQERTSNLAKCYFKRFQAEVLPVGSDYSITATFMPVCNIESSQF